MAEQPTIGKLYYEMMRACYNEKSVTYKSIGAKGIKVCDEWHNKNNFIKWAKDNGFVKGLRLERLDKSKDFYPENCKFGITYKKDYYSKNQTLIRKINNRKIDKKVIEDYFGVNSIKDCRLYNIYNKMKQRCYNEKVEEYCYYGARGIKICDDWLEHQKGFIRFFEWSVNNGYNDELSIDRINVDGNYEPNNCRWANRIEQANNKTNTLKVYYKGIYLSLYDISILENVELTELRDKYKIYNDSEKALNEIKKMGQNF